MILELAADSSSFARGAAALVLGLHITAGVVGIASGATALVARKGSTLHQRSGIWFLASMLAMAAIGAAVSPFLPRPDLANVLAGVFTIYLIASSWATIRRTGAATGRFDVAALIVVLAVVAAEFTLGIRAALRPAGSPADAPVAAYFVFGGIALLAAAGDLRVVLRGRRQGAQRVTRHLWRMCVALLIAAFSFFLGQAQVFPAFLRRSPLLFVPEIAVLAVMVFWLIRVRIGTRFKSGPAPRAALLTGR